MTPLARAQANLMRNPHHPHAWRELGVAHYFLTGAGEDHYGEANACLGRAAGMAPDDVGCLMSFAAMCSLCRADQSALDFYTRAFDRADMGKDIISNGMAAALLRMGRWEEGWHVHEGRLQYHETRGAMYHPYGLAELEGHDHVLVRFEQGYGDSLMFVRFIPELQKRLGQHVTIHLETESKLIPLFQLALHGNIKVISEAETQHLIAAHADDTPAMPHVSMMSLPYLLGPPYEPHVPPLDFLPRRLLKRSPARHTGIGLCWAGGHRENDVEAAAINRRKSIPLEIFNPIGEAAGSSAVLLQQGPGFQPADWLETANIVLRKCGLVITVDTAIAHLAASLGIETWVLNRFDRCWRYDENGKTTPWYPTVTCFTQPWLGAWEQVVDQVVPQVIAWKERNGATSPSDPAPSNLPMSNLR